MCGQDGEPVLWACEINVSFLSCKLGSITHLSANNVRVPRGTPGAGKMCRETGFHLPGKVQPGLRAGEGGVDARAGLGRSCTWVVRTLSAVRTVPA